MQFALALASCHLCTSRPKLALSCDLVKSAYFSINIAVYIQVTVHVPATDLTPVVRNEFAFESTGRSKTLARLGSLGGV